MGTLKIVKTSNVILLLPRALPIFSHIFPKGRKSKTVAPLSKNVADFVSANRPASDVVSLAEIEAAVKALGLVFVKGDDNSDAAQEARLRHDLGDRSTFAYDPKVVGAKTVFSRGINPLWYTSNTMTNLDTQVVYTPHLNDGYALDERVVAQLGFAPIVVQLPEPVLSLPQPKWLNVVFDGSFGEMEAPFYFLSEARPMWREHLAEMFAVGQMLADPS
jgi:hypothetical protein